MISASLSLSLPRFGWKSTSMPRSLKICTAAGDRASEIRTLGLDMGCDPLEDAEFDDVARGLDPWVHLLDGWPGRTRSRASRFSPAMTAMKRSYAALASDSLVSANAQSIH